MLAALRQCRFARVAVLATVLAGFLLALALAASPRLHELVHHDEHGDGGAPAHECLATILVAGGCDDVLAVVAFLLEPLPVRVQAFVAAEDEQLGSFYLASRPLEHAPPVLS